MWYLKREDRILYLRGDKSSSFVGRSSEVCDLVLANDASISRRHAVLKLESGNLTVQDLGSKYGTYINDNIENKTALGPSEVVELKCNDKVRFGSLENTWTVHYVKLITCTSTMKGENLEAMKADLDIIGASLHSEWDDSCTHLTMPAITLTAKVLAALAYGSHIVTVDYWKEWRKVVVSGGNPPNPSDYLPEVIENTLNKELVSFTPDERRTKIFTGKKFIFFSRKQLNFYKMVLERCGATVGLLSECKLTKSKLCDDNIIVVQYSGALPGQESQSQRQVISNIVNYMAEKSQRVIPDIEIGLAVLLISSAQYCNPKKNFIQLFNRESTDNKQNANILAPETEEISLGNKEKSGVVIDESLVSMSRDDADWNISFDVEETGNSNKRKLPEDSPIFETTAKKRNLNAIHENNRDEEVFAFVKEEASSTTKSPMKELNFLKTKNNKNSNSEDDNIFNFLPDIPDNNPPNDDNVSSSCKSNLLSLTGGMKRKAEDSSEMSIAKKQNVEKPKYLKDYNLKLDIAELLKNTFWKSCATEAIKEEMIKREGNDESKLDMGTTIVNVRNDLIIKSETPVPYGTCSSNTGPNFKKFKKVLPLKMQITVIQSCSKSVLQNVGQTVESLSSDDEEMRLWVEDVKASKKRIR